MTISKAEYEKFYSEFFKGEQPSKKRKYSSSTVSILGGFLLLIALLLVLPIQIIETYKMSLPPLVGLIPSVVIFVAVAKLNITENKEKRFYDLGKVNIFLLIVYAAFSLATSQSNDCTDKAQTAHGWDKDIYHHCMKTPRGFQW